MILGEIFQTRTQTINGWRNPDQKFLIRTHHYLTCYTLSFGRGNIPCYLNICDEVTNMFNSGEEDFIQIWPLFT